MMRLVRPSSYSHYFSHYSSSATRITTSTQQTATALHHTLRQFSWARTIHAFSLTASSPYLASINQPSTIFASIFLASFLSFLRTFIAGKRANLFFSSHGWATGTQESGLARHGTARHRNRARAQVRARAHGHGHGHKGATIKTDSEPLARAHITL